MGRLLEGLWLLVVLLRREVLLIARLLLLGVEEVGD